MIQDTYKNYLDVNGLVKPQLTWTNSGNGILYTSLAVVLGYTRKEDWVYYKSVILSCIDSNGVLMRTPDNQFGQQSWDDYLGLAVACLVLGETEIPQHMIWSSICHLGCMLNGKGWSDISKSFLWRFPIIWVIMGAAAFPCMAKLYKCIIQAYMFMFKPKVNYHDQSGTQLQFLQLYALSYLGDVKPLKTWLNELKLSLPTACDYPLSEVMEPYYSSGHPLVEGFKKICLIL